MHVNICQVHESAGQTLADIITISSHMPNSPLLGQLESESFVAQLFTYFYSPIPHRNQTPTFHCTVLKLN
jgi:hypothetical protein